MAAPVCSVLQIDPVKVAFGFNAEKGIEIWNLESNTCVGKLFGHTDQVRDMIMVLNEVLLSCCLEKDPQIIMWDVNKLQKIKVFN